MMMNEGTIILLGGYYKVSMIVSNVVLSSAVIVIVISKIQSLTLIVALAVSMMSCLIGESEVD